MCFNTSRPFVSHMVCWVSVPRHPVTGGVGLFRPGSSSFWCPTIWKTWRDLLELGVGTAVAWRVVLVPIGSHLAHISTGLVRQLLLLGFSPKPEATKRGHRRKRPCCPRTPALAEDACVGRRRRVGRRRMLAATAQRLASSDPTRRARVRVRPDSPRQGLFNEVIKCTSVRR